MSGWLPSVCGRCCITIEKLHDDKEDGSPAQLNNTLPLVPKLLPWPKSCGLQGSWSLLFRLLYALLLLPWVSALGYLRLQPASGGDQTKGNLKGWSAGGWKLSRETDFRWYWGVLLLIWALAILGIPFLVAYGLVSQNSEEAGSDGYVWMWFCILVIPLIIIAASSARSLSMPMVIVLRGRGRSSLWMPLWTITGWRNAVAAVGLVLEMLQLSALAFANHGDENPFWVLLFDWPGTFKPMFYVCLVSVYLWHCILSFIIALSASISHPGDSAKRFKDNFTINVQHLPIVNIIHPIMADLCLVTVVYHLFRALSCTKQASGLVLVADTEVACWVGAQQAEGAVAMLALSLFAPFAILLSPLLRADSSLHSLVRCQTSKVNNRRGSWMKSNEPEYPEVQLRPAFSALDRVIKFILIAFAVMLRGQQTPILIVFFVLLSTRVILSRFMPADQEALHIHRGPCYFAALNHPLLYSYVATFLANPISAITFWLHWQEGWHKIIFMAVMWILLAGCFWWANYSYFRGMDERPKARTSAHEMDVRPEDDTGGLIKNESGDHLEPHEEAAGLAAIAESAGSAMLLVSDAPSSTSYQTRPSPSVASGVSKRRSQSNEKSEYARSSSNKSHGAIVPANQPSSVVSKKEVAWEEERGTVVSGGSTDHRPPELSRPPNNHLITLSPKKAASGELFPEVHDQPIQFKNAGGKSAIAIDIEALVRKDNPLAGLPHAVLTNSLELEADVLASKAEIITAEDLNAIAKVQAQLQDTPKEAPTRYTPSAEELDHRHLVQMQQQMMLDQLQQQERPPNGLPPASPQARGMPLPGPTPAPQPMMQFPPQQAVYLAQPFIEPPHYSPLDASQSVSSATLQRAPPPGMYPPHAHLQHFHAHPQYPQPMPNHHHFHQHYLQHQQQHQHQHHHLQAEFLAAAPHPSAPPGAYGMPPELHAMGYENTPMQQFLMPRQPQVAQYMPPSSLQDMYPSGYPQPAEVDGEAAPVEADELDDHDRKSAEGNYWNANEDEEDRNEYRYGGYHPVFPGEVFNNRFKAIRKLGWGEFSTVWLAWDFVHHQFVALKVSKSAPDYRKASMWEVQIFECMNERLKGTADEHTQKGFHKESHNCPDSQCVVRMYDSFDHVGENGSHLVMVFEVLGPNLLSLISAHDFKGIHINIVKSITKQILKGLSFIHDQINVIHTDLKPENILMNRPSEGVASTIVEYLQKMKEETGQDFHHLLPFQERDVGGLSFVDRLAYEYGITISDLGAARWLNKEYPPAVIQTREYRSPEVIMGYAKVGTAIDIWSLACIVFELITGDFLFDPKSEKTIDKDVYHIALFMQVLGDVPKSMALGPGKNCPKFFNKRGEFRHKCRLQPCQLSAVFLHNYGLPEPEAEELASFLLPMLEFIPSKRITAREALKHPWLTIHEPE